MVRRTGWTRRGLAGLALAVGCGRALGQERQRLLLLTGAPGGAFYEYGPILARIAAAAAPIDLDVRPSAGSNENIRALASGEADLGLVSMGPAFDAWNGRPPATSGPTSNLRALFPMYDTPFCLVALTASGVSDLASLTDRKVGVGPAGGPGQAFFAGLATAIGLKATVVTGSPTELARQVVSGEIDAFWYGAGTPVAAFVDVLDRADAFVFGLSPAEVAAFQRSFAYMSPTEIPAGSYKGQTAPLKTASVWNFALASDRLGEDAAYALTRAVLEHTAEMTAEMSAASGTAIRNVGADTFMPIHPGAARYYREAGVALPHAIAPA